ncbi:2-polyprenyl-6-methoxyphenol hydroxylase-like FAD-dependent oxidoreductase [Rhodococcus sp. 27YEA15]
MRDRSIRETEVLIVGAGPVGLVCGVLLRTYGVECTIVEKSRSRDRRARAISLHAPTLELFSELGLLEGISGYAERLTSISLYGRNNSYVGDLTGLDSPYEGYWNVEQPIYEESLEGLYEELGGTLIRGLEVTSVLKQSAELRPPSPNCDDAPSPRRVDRVDQSTSHIHFQFIICADGVGSSTWNLLVGNNERLRKQHSGEYLLLEGVPALKSQVADTGIYIGSDGMVTRAPLTQGRVRIAGPAQPGLSRANSVADLIKAVDKMGYGQTLRLREIERSSVYRVSASIVPRPFDLSMRFCVVGDAAHTTPPAGGQGLNSGIADALSLCWRLALFLKGSSGAEVFDGITDDIQANARHAIESADISTAVRLIRENRTENDSAIRHEMSTRAIAWSQIYRGRGNPLLRRHGLKLHSGDRVPSARRIVDGQSRSMHVSALPVNRIGLTFTKLRRDTLTTDVMPSKFWPDDVAELVLRPDGVVL